MFAQLPIRQLHYNEDTWGPGPESLSATRFLENPKLSKSISYRPWGGGHTLCPGRFLARKSANAFVAILLSRYDVTIDNTNFPKADGARPSPGVISVAQGEDLALRLMPRKGV
jgi:cytochrome P450